MKDSEFIERSPRIDVHRPILLINSQGNEHPVTLVNVSSRGFALETEQPLFAGEHVRLRIDRHEELLAQIRWTMSYEAGGMFTEPVKLL